MKQPIRDLFLQFRFVAKGALQGAISTNTKVHPNFAKDCPLTLVKGRLALGSPGCSVGSLIVTMPKMAEYTDK